MHTIYLALGANIGNKKEAIMNATKLLSEKIVIEKKAPLYETKPWGFTKQGNFLNTALMGTTNLSPEELLIFIKEIEEKAGRVKRFTNGPREIDIDILLYDNVVLETPTLSIPHKRLFERDFVLQPLVDIAAHLIHPQLHELMQELLEKIPSSNRFIVKKLNGTF